MEGELEILFYLLERVGEHFLRRVVDFVDVGYERVFGSPQIVRLRFEEVVAFLEFGVFLYCNKVYRAHCIYALAQLAHLVFHRRKIKRLHRVEILLRRLAARLFGSGRNLAVLKLVELYPAFKLLVGSPHFRLPVNARNLHFVFV